MDISHSFLSQIISSRPGNEKAVKFVVLDCPWTFSKGLFDMSLLGIQYELQHPLQTYIIVARIYAPFPSKDCRDIEINNHCLSKV